MAAVVVYRSDCSLVRPDGGYAIDWEEWSWEPRPREDTTSVGRWRRWRSAPQPVAIGTRLGTQGLSAASVHWLAIRGEKGFSLVGGDSDMARKKAAGGPGLFGGDEPTAEPTAYPKPGLVVGRLNDSSELPVGVQVLRRMHADGVIECGPTLELMPDGSTVVHEVPARPDLAALRPVVAELAAEVMAEERARHLATVQRYERYNEALASDRNRLLVAVARAIGLMRQEMFESARTVLESAKEDVEAS